MKDTAALSASLAAILAGAGFCHIVTADGVLPQAPATGRYEKMADRSPFAPPTLAVGTPVAAPLPAGPKWSDDLTVTLLTQQGGVYFATIQDKAKNERFLLQSNKEDKDRHLAVASVQWSDLVDQTMVTLRHNNEFAPVRFEANAAAPVANSGPRPGRASGPGSFPSAGNTPGAVRLPPPPSPPPTANLVRRLAPIRTTPTVAAPSNFSAPRLVPRPLSSRTDENQ